MRDPSVLSIILGFVTLSLLAIITSLVLHPWHGTRRDLKIALFLGFVAFATSWLTYMSL